MAAHFIPVGRPVASLLWNRFWSVLGFGWSSENVGASGWTFGKGQRVIEMDQKLEANGPGEGSRKAVVQVWKPELQSSRVVQHKPTASNKCRSPNNMVIFSQQFSMKINMAPFHEDSYNQGGSHFTNKHEQRPALQARRSEERGPSQP